MELLKAIHERRTVRDFSDAALTPALVEELIRAANCAPSALNQQPWSFAVFHGRGRLRRYSARAKLHLLATTDPSFGLDPRIDQYARDELNLFHEADTLVLVCAKPARFTPAEDCFLAVQNLLLAAHGLGLGACPVGFARPWFALPEVKAELGVPPHHTPVMPVVVGHPARGPSRPAPPKAAPEFVSWRWDE